jgi:hypothetical protein
MCRSSTLPTRCSSLYKPCPHREHDVLSVENIEDKVIIFGAAGKKDGTWRGIDENSKINRPLRRPRWGSEIKLKVKWLSIRA